MNNTSYADEHTTATILAIRNQLSATMGIGFEVDNTTTINSKRNVLPNATIKTFPKIRYFGIGIKGYANITNENNIAQPYKPSMEDLDLYEPIPFRCVAGAPLPADEAQNYRMRTVAVINGITYYQYWLKLIEFQDAVPRLTKIVKSSESDYTVDASSLWPTPTDLSPTDLTTSTERIVASVTGVCRVTGAEVEEVINAMYGGDMRRARISEFGTYSGVEYAAKAGECGEFPAGNEAIYVQLCTHKCTLGQTLSKSGADLVETKVFENGSCTTI